eukprot:11197538-Heterocapsa_arctica.AAC.1
MLSKNGRGYDPNDVPKAKRLKHNLADLFLSGQVSGHRSQTLFEDAAVKFDNVQGLAKAGCNGKFANNCARDLSRKLLKDSEWPRPYMASVRVLDVATQLPHVVQVPLILPHELVAALVKKAGGASGLLRQAGLNDDIKSHLAKAEQELGAQHGHLLACALWGDGVPYNWDRTQSLDVFTLSFP